MSRLRYAVRSNHPLVVNGETMFNVAFEHNGNKRYADKQSRWTIRPGEHVRVVDPVALETLLGMTDIDGAPLFVVVGDAGLTRRDLDAEVFEPLRRARERGRP